MVLAHQEDTTGLGRRDTPDREYSVEEVAHGYRADGATAEEIAEPVRRAIEHENEHENSERRTELEARKMVMPNTQVTLRIEVHLGEDRELFLMDISCSVRWAVLEKAIRSQCSVPPKHLFFWLHPGGNVVALDNSQAFSQYVLTMWCTHPWIVHAHAGGSQLSSLAYASHVQTAKALFSRYDVNANGRVERCAANHHPNRHPYLAP